MEQNYQLLSIGTGRPALLRQLLEDRNSSFYSNAAIQRLGLTPESDLVHRLLRLSSGGTNVYPHNFNTYTPGQLGINIDDLRNLGDGLRALNIMVTVSGQDVPKIQLLSTEFNHWQGTGRSSTLTPGPELPPDVWARREDVLIQDMGPRYRAGDQSYHMESIIGERRMFSTGSTREYTVNYGSVEIIDRDPRSPTCGHPLNMGDGALDAYLPEDLLKQVRNGQPLYGPVLIRQRVEGSRPDPRVYYLSPELPNAQAAILCESDNWQEENRSEVRELAGVTFPAGTMLQDGLIRDLSAAGSRVAFIPMSGAQYQAWQYALSEHSEIRSISPQRWIDETFGGRAQFDAAFSGYEDGKLLPLEEYHRVMEGVRLVGTIRVDESSKTVEVVESHIYAYGQNVDSRDGSRQGDGRLSNNEMAAVLQYMQSNPEEFTRMVQQLREAGIEFTPNFASNASLPQSAGSIQLG